MESQQRLPCPRAERLRTRTRRSRAETPLSPGAGGSLLGRSMQTTDPARTLGAIHTPVSVVLIRLRPLRIHWAATRFIPLEEHLAISKQKHNTINSRMV